ncbi:MAG: hypothetical protein NTW41_00095 [Verrucomicrobia bacterium]|nr:hypothetical protein [Verrucomicrobiota bacterium]
MKYIYCFKYVAGGEPACGYVIGEHGTDVLGLQKEGALVETAVANHPGVEVGGLVIEAFIQAPYREDKLEGHRTVQLLKDPVIPRDQVLFDRNAIKVGIPEKPQTAICRVEHDLIDTVSLVEVSDMISRAGKMLEKYLNSMIRPVEGDAGFSAVGAGHGVLNSLENVVWSHKSPI